MMIMIVIIMMIMILIMMMMMAITDDHYDDYDDDCVDVHLVVKASKRCHEVLPGRPTLRLKTKVLCDFASF